jgi:hypothetical protein
MTLYLFINRDKNNISVWHEIEPRFNQGTKNLPSLFEISTILNENTCTNYKTNYEMNRCTKSDNKMLNLDADFLFPKNEVHSKLDSVENVSFESTGRTLYLNSSSPNIQNTRIFNVDKIPKVAFELMHRDKIASKEPRRSMLNDEDINEVQDDTVEMKRSIFGLTRDDLYYKTIVRDVRKYLQDQFKRFLKAETINQSLNNGTFLKRLKDFSRQVEPFTTYNTDHQLLLSTIGSLVCWAGYLPYCPPNLKPICKGIDNTLQKFTKMKLKSLIAHTGFKEIFHYYAANTGENSDYSRIKQHKTMHRNVVGYKYVLNDILSKCYL